jgi:hypothetical protein
MRHRDTELRGINSRVVVPIPRVDGRYQYPVCSSDHMECQCDMVFSHLLVSFTCSININGTNRMILINTDGKTYLQILLLPNHNGVGHTIITLAIHHTSSPTWVEIKSPKLLYFTKSKSYPVDSGTIQPRLLQRQQYEVRIQQHRHGSTSS